jgi:muconolactone delta-isomerase
MEYLVTMTTNVPHGTSDSAVDDIRSREAARSRELSTEGHLLRLWRPPLQRGEWRSFGLFEAAGGDELEELLLSMPLRVWRTDEVLPLSPHPNDPGRDTDQRGSLPAAGGSEFLTRFTLTVPPDVPSEIVEKTTASEADRTRELAGQGQLLRLWTLSDDGQSLGLWHAREDDEMQATLASLPLGAWMRVETVKLSPHPNDPILRHS